MAVAQVCRVDDRIDGAFDERMTIEALLEDAHLWWVVWIAHETPVNSG